MGSLISTQAPRLAFRTRSPANQNQNKKTAGKVNKCGYGKHWQPVEKHIGQPVSIKLLQYKMTGSRNPHRAIMKYI
jgi:hypothetical protein